MSSVIAPNDFTKILYRIASRIPVISPKTPNKIGIPISEPKASIVL